jgi:hypothetical protein
LAHSTSLPPALPAARKHRCASASSRIFRPAISNLHEARILRAAIRFVIPPSLMGHPIARFSANHQVSVGIALTGLAF